MRKMPDATTSQLKQTNKVGVNGGFKSSRQVILCFPASHPGLPGKAYVCKEDLSYALLTVASW